MGRKNGAPSDEGGYAENVQGRRRGDVDLEKSGIMGVVKNDRDLGPLIMLIQGL